MSFLILTTQSGRRPRHTSHRWSYTPGAGLPVDRKLWQFLASVASGTRKCTFAMGQLHCAVTRHKGGHGARPRAREDPRARLAPADAPGGPARAPPPPLARPGAVRAQQLEHLLRVID